MKKVFLGLCFLIASTVNANGEAQKVDVNKNLEIKKTMKKINIGETYEHYSGKRYTIKNLAFHSEDPEIVMVVYEGLYDDPKFGKNPVWVRPLKMFVEDVEIKGKVVPRFKKVD